MLLPIRNTPEWAARFSLTDRRETQLGDEFPAQVLDYHLLRANLEGLLLDGGPVLLLADVRKETDDIVALVLANC